MTQKSLDLAATRREMLTRAGAVGLSAALGPGFAQAAGRGLKDIVRTRTFDAEVHVDSLKWWGGPDLPAERPYSRDQLVKDTLGMEWQEGEPGFEENLERLAPHKRLIDLVPRAKTLVAEFDAAGIDTGCCLIIDHAYEQSNIGRKYKMAYEDILAESSKLRESLPGRFVVFAGVDPRRGGKDGAKLLRRILTEYGCSGLGEEVFQQYDVFPDDRERCYPLYEVCVERGVPFYGNCEGPAPETMPNAYEQVAKDFPTLKICLAGSGRPRTKAEPNEAAWQPTRDAIRLASTYENVYLDTADWWRRNPEGIRRYLAFLRACFDSDARRKVMFATDYPVFVAMGSEKSWVDVLIDVQDEGLAISEEELALFYGKNAQDFLKGVL